MTYIENKPTANYTYSLERKKKVNYKYQITFTSFIVNKN